MTTICVVDNVVYGDGQATAEMITSYTTKKITNLGSCIVAGAGRYAHVVAFSDWVSQCIEATAVQEANPYVQVNMPEEMVEDDFHGIILYPDGTVTMYEGSKNFYNVEQPVFLGSGSVFAAGAVHAGATGEEAIQAAIALDTGTGGEIQIESFDSVEPDITEDLLSTLTKEEIMEKLFPKDTEQEAMFDEMEKAQDAIIEEAYEHIGLTQAEKDFLASIEKQVEDYVVNGPPTVEEALGSVLPEEDATLSSFQAKEPVEYKDYNLKGCTLRDFGNPDTVMIYIGDSEYGLDDLCMLPLMVLQQMCEAMEITYKSSNKAKTLMQRINFKIKEITQ